MKINDKISKYKSKDVEYYQPRLEFLKYITLGVGIYVVLSHWIISFYIEMQYDINVILYFTIAIIVIINMFFASKGGNTSYSSQGAWSVKRPKSKTSLHFFVWSIGLLIILIFISVLSTGGTRESYLTALFITTFTLSITMTESKKIRFWGTIICGILFIIATFEGNKIEKMDSTNIYNVFYLITLVGSIIISFLLARKGTYDPFKTEEDKTDKIFTEDFSDESLSKWEYRGPWSVNNGILTVTGSNEGGIIKDGIVWENYNFTFKAKIHSKGLGVIIRAKDLNNYFMFQINLNKIRYLYRTEKERSGWKEDIISAKPHGYNLKEWFDVKVIVNDKSLRLFINNNLIIEQNSILEISKGSIGFRNWGDEKAQVKNLKVRNNP